MSLDRSTVARALGGEVSGQQVLAPGPGHSKADRSMSVLVDADAPDGFVVSSFAGDDINECRDHVRAQLNMPQWQPTKKQEAEPKPTVVAQYVYKQANGSPYLRVTRLSNKKFLQAKWDDEDLKWVSGKPDGPKIPYLLPELIKADPAESVWIVEGEKAADYCTKLGMIATTASEGAGSWKPDLNHWFRGRTVFVIPDNDEVGRKHARTISDQTGAIIVSLPYKAPKHGADDWLAQGHTIADLLEIANNPPESEPEPESEVTPEAIADAPDATLNPTPFRWVDPANIQPLQWLYGRHLVRGYVSATIAPGGLGKSSLLQVEALAMASGRKLLGEYVHKPMRVWYWSGEDDNEDSRRRTVAAAVHHNLPPAEFVDRLWHDSGREHEIIIASETGRDFTTNADLEERLIHFITANLIDVWILDPFVTAHQVNENSNSAINAVLSVLRRIATRTNCAIEIVHHIRKPGGGITADTDVNDARGASALIGAVRSARVLNAMSQEEADRLDIENRLSYFRVDNGKSNLSARSDHALWRRIIGHDLGNATDEYPMGDSVGVVEAWEPPAAFDRLPKDAPRIAQRVAIGGNYRLDPRSSDWIGHPLAAEFIMDADDKADGSILKKVIAQWVKNKILLVEMRIDKQRKMKPFLLPGSAISTEDDYDFS